MTLANRAKALSRFLQLITGQKRPRFLGSNKIVRQAGCRSFNGQIIAPMVHIGEHNGAYLLRSDENGDIWLCQSDGLEIAHVYDKESFIKAWLYCCG
jgi:hypothetical protein